MGGPAATLNFDPRDLTTAEFTDCASQLYDLLRSFGSSFELAAVGWDPEGHINPAELDEWIADGELHRLDGLVVTDSIRHEWEQHAEWERFDESHWWIPLETRQPVRSPEAR